MTRCVIRSIEAVDARFPLPEARAATSCTDLSPPSVISPLAVIRPNWK